jgi:hypothetical protein
MTTIQDRIIISFDNFRNFDGSEYGLVLHEKIKQFLIKSIKEVEEETRKEVVEECKQKMAQSNEWWNKKFLSITNKESKNG